MREIKFRAWDGERFMFRGIHDRNWYTESKGGKCIKGTHPDDRKMITMQYTGLKDKNGVEIYQGDICKVMYHTPFGDKADNYYGKWIVTEWMGQFVMVSGKERVSFTNFADVVSSEYVPNLGTVCELSAKVNVEVIGNIHQNPELLD